MKKSKRTKSTSSAEKPKSASESKRTNKNEQKDCNPFKWLVAVIVVFAIASVSIFGIVMLQRKSQTKNDAEIIDIVVDNFMPLTQVPRPSHHEEQISNWLADWAKEHGFNPVQDSVYNVMFDVPATAGMENKPLGILQGHMDMVVAVADGKNFNPLTDKITAIRNDAEGTLTADGTSLGADDGIGVAMILAVAQGRMAHGPLRMIITVDEEDGMTGALNISPSWFDGASFLINIDNEWSNQVLASTAAGDSISISQDTAYTYATGNVALNIEISNLKGGHSGVEIDKGRLNGIIGLANFLKQLSNHTINYELASFEGGTAANAIPAKANATIVVNAANKTIVTEKIKEYCTALNAKYNGIEDEISCIVSEANNVPKVVYKSARDNLIKFITEVPNGVYTMSKDLEGLVESSSNLGIVKLGQDGLKIAALIRSSSPEKETELVAKELELAKTCGYTATSNKTTDAWPFDPYSKLLDITQRVYKEQNGEDIIVSAVHAGLECGSFKRIKSDLDMVSIGPDLKDGHTINETLVLGSVPRIWRLLEGILARY